MTSDAPRHLARNLRLLRDRRGWTQQRLADEADVPRATLATLESGESNPTLAVLCRLSAALGVGLDELVGPPRTSVRLLAPDELPERGRGGVTVRALLPANPARVEVDRFELAPGAAMAGVPHTPGTQEFLTTETGVVEVAVAGRRFRVPEGHVLVFPGDQRHSYRNPGDRPAVAYAVVAVVPVGALPT